MAPPAKVICTCTSHGCSKKVYSEDGIIKDGQRVDPATRTAHCLQDQRNKLIVQSAAAINSFCPPVPAPGNPPPQAVVNDDLIKSFANLSVTLNAQPSASNTQTRDSSSEDPDDNPNVEHLKNMPQYHDCSRFHINFINKNPAELLINLKTSLFYVTQQVSLPASAYLLRLDRQLIEVVTTHGLDETSQPRTLTYSERKTLNSFPKDPSTVIRHLAIDPDLHFLNPVEDPNEFKNQFEDDEDPESCTERDSSHADEDNQQVYGADLFYEYALERTAKASSSPFNNMADMSDIQESRLWWEFLGPNGKQFSAHSGNLIFGMFVDGINPYGNRQAGKHASFTFMMLVCLSLPVSLRYLPKNVFLFGIAPGPKEPSLEQTNQIFRPLVEQLKSLWNPGVYLSQTFQHPQGRLICAALLPFFDDLPALQRSLGFAGHNAKRMFSFCLIDKKDIKNFDKQTWPLQNLVDHRYWANQSREALNAKAKKQILSDHGVQYSVLLELSYWNIVDYHHVVDAMHMLYRHGENMGGCFF
ncbi:hypothetical protein PCANC_12430 [Puccinia coronata f. sp. avenae]|uniref:Uncharacterized protein n=1 Tax=Puccinia coronata f. sp. avenae TaxID=200324 RepID=A0A2N5VBE8_9BASI|nr:hypothetical protein PCANC_12430 [Puccinia coronata f. sp. avenae]